MLPEHTVVFPPEIVPLYVVLATLTKNEGEITGSQLPLVRTTLKYVSVETTASYSLALASSMGVKSISFDDICHCIAPIPLLLVSSLLSPGHI